MSPLSLERIKMLFQTPNPLYFLEKDTKDKTKNCDFDTKMQKTPKKSPVLLAGTLWLFEVNKDPETI